MEAAIEHAAEVSMVPALVKRMEATHRELREAMLRRVNDWRKALLARHVPACRDVLQRLVGRFELIDPAGLPDYVRAMMPDPERFRVNPAFSGLISPHAFDLDTYVWRPRADLNRRPTA